MLWSRAEGTVGVREEEGVPLKYASLYVLVTGSIRARHARSIAHNSVGNCCLGWRVDRASEVRTDPTHISEHRLQRSCENHTQQKHQEATYPLNSCVSVHVCSVIAPLLFFILSYFRYMHRISSFCPSPTVLPNVCPSFLHFFCFIPVVFLVSRSCKACGRELMPE